jgi:polyhydroxyalkanoate synthesis regulator phasin
VSLRETLVILSRTRKKTKVRVGEPIKGHRSKHKETGNRSENRTIKANTRKLQKFHQASMSSLAERVMRLRARRAVVVRNKTSGKMKQV